MVYCGKPSRACHACRQKKTRCDAKPEGCTPCARTGRQCPGYREQVDLMFRDQSSTVIRKAKAAEAKKASTPAARSFASSRESTPKSEASEDLELVARRWDPIFSLGPTVDERAMCFFVFHYLVGIQAPSRGVLDNLLLLYQTNSVDQILLTAVKAVSYASYAHHTQSTDLTEVSTYQYTRAVTLTNDALRSSASATKDSTLMSVMILSMYEILTGGTQRSLQAWMEHIRGSAALVKLRGEDQLKTPQGRRLFIQASIGILTSCVQLRIPVPKIVPTLLAKMKSQVDANDDFAQISFGIHSMMIEINQFLAAVAKQNIPSLFDIVSQALELDAKLMELMSNSPPEFRYQEFHGPDSDVAYQGTYHVYFDLLIANLWNSIRVFRILLHEQIREILLKGFATNPPTFTKREHTRQLQRSMDTCYELQAGILYSVPQHLGYVGNLSIWNRSGHMLWRRDALSPETAASFGLNSLPDAKPHVSTEEKEGSQDSAMMDISPTAATTSVPPHPLIQTPQIRASGGYNLMWPLWLAGAMDLVTEEVQKYTVGIMKRIGQDMGIRQAFMLAKVIADKEIVIDAWQNKAKFEIDDD